MSKAKQYIEDLGDAIKKEIAGEPTPWAKFAQQQGKTEEQLRAEGKSPPPHCKRVLTCKNHPTLRWSTKREFGRTLFYDGQVFDPPLFYSDFSGMISNRDPLEHPECDCPYEDLIPAPEDKILNADLYKD